MTKTKKVEPEKLNDIKVVLAKKGKSQKWLYEKINTNKVTCSRWCNQHDQPSIKTLHQIAKAFKSEGIDVSPKDLIRDLEE